MNTIEVKTNIMCGSCIEKVTTVLNEVVGKDQWKVNTQDPKKILVVQTNELTEEDIIKAVEKAGYKAEKI